MLAIDRIEVIRRPSSALYGANAFLGVVNIITKCGKDSVFDEVNILNQNETKDTRLYPSTMAKAGINYTLPKQKLNANLSVFYISGRIASYQNLRNFSTFDNTTYSLPAYTLLDMCISSHELKIFGSHETLFTLKINNLLNTKYAMPGFYNFDISGLNRFYSLTINQKF